MATIERLKTDQWQRLRDTVCACSKPILIRSDRPSNANKSIPPTVGGAGAEP